ncbi:MAG: restriction endonuclease subunit R, partial [Moraxellaceae bacterium]
MPALNIPPFACKLTESAGVKMIYDMFRKKYVVLTPEEWVRQHMLHFLTGHLHYPKGLIKVEGGLRYNQLQK